MNILIPAGIVLAVILGLRSKSGASSISGGSVSDPRYPVKVWEPIVIALAPPAGVSIPFVLKWIEVESGGNPCAFGTPGAVGPDGNPRELGIAQLYNPDDVVRLRVDPKHLRAYCVPGTQRVSRTLTPEEMREQAQAAVDLASYCKLRAATVLGTGSGWGERDLYALTKLYHGLPGLVTRGLPAVKTYLGHVPGGFASFAENLRNVKLDAGTERYRSQFDRILANAARTAAVVPGPGTIPGPVSHRGDV